ncbi:pyridoxal phosphate-dependent transferase [Dioszegia hungarica]|uniref:Pyridoxal phosphate-dependent transferase n=1 Tax=Dioszegia hungarica TaxID=4972 RepID=A0AA38LQK0_9TREE|nr:pyridoxal phosphate-dependent transferase [Dioszegia hungarica]KAI9633417.1 pyridoxal phosphate-dependent transferase [Dioszegia hungarica]
MKMEDAETYNFFFYGTLCHPTILSRVLRRPVDGLQFEDAILPGYTRHHVKNEDYPAVIDKQSAEKLLSATSEARDVDFSTRGTLVKGLDLRDVMALDTFEGNQYARRQLPIRIMGSGPAISQADRADSSGVSKPSSALSAVGQAVAAVKTALSPDGPGGGLKGDQADDAGQVAWVYVWSDDIKHLEPSIWDFETFVRDKADVWTGSSTKEYDDVERHHAEQKSHGTTGEQARNGTASELEGQRKEGYPDFGHNMLKYWAFKDGYLNFNNGSYGSPPLPVLRAIRSLSDECEARPDHFIKRAYLPHLHEARRRVTELIGASMDEVVIVPGATHGMNNILREIDWAEGDIILAYNTTYGAVAQTIKYLVDRNPTLSLEVISLDFPVSHAEIVKRTEEVLAKYNSPAIPNYTGQAKPTGLDVKKRIRGLVIDQIASMPGMIYPMDSLVGLCKKYGVYSMVDAAHAIGQVKTDVKASDPDFWVSNCHKWLYAHRACAVLYIPNRNQGLIRSSLPTGYGYESESHPAPGVTRKQEWAKQYDYVSTQDWGPFFSINSALDFRKEIGGEDRIIAYNHALAVAGGKRLAERWGGERVVMETPEGELTAAMLNVFLPDFPVPEKAEEALEAKKYIEDKLFEGDAFCAIYAHAGKVCARFSCQVWIELEDFDRIADILDDAMAGIRQGKHRSREMVGSEMLHRTEDVPIMKDE